MNKSYVSPHLSSLNNSPGRYPVKGREEVPKARNSVKRPSTKYQTTNKCATATIDIGSIHDDEAQMYTLKGQHSTNGGFTYAYNAPSLDDYNTENYAHGTRLAEKSLVQSTGTYKFQCKLVCPEIQPHQDLFIIGSIPELGNWQ